MAREFLPFINPQKNVSATVPTKLSRFSGTQEEINTNFESEQPQYIVDISQIDFQGMQITNNGQEINNIKDFIDALEDELIPAGGGINNETDPTVPSYVKAITQQNITDWNNKATTSDVQTAVAGLVDSAPETLNTLNELAAALGDDPNFATTVSNQIGAKYTKPSGGVPKTDLASVVQTSLGKADSSIQGVQVNGVNQTTNENKYVNLNLNNYVLKSNARIIDLSETEDNKTIITTNAVGELTLYGPQGELTWANDLEVLTTNSNVHTIGIVSTSKYISSQESYTMTPDFVFYPSDSNIYNMSTGDDFIGDFEVNINTEKKQIPDLGTQSALKITSGVQSGNYRVNLDFGLPGMLILKNNESGSKYHYNYNNTAFTSLTDILGGSSYLPYSYSATSTSSNSLYYIDGTTTYANITSDSNLSNTYYNAYIPEITQVYNQSNFEILIKPKTNYIYSNSTLVLNYTFIPADVLQKRYTIDPYSVRGETFIEQLTFSSLNVKDNKTLTINNIVFNEDATDYIYVSQTAPNNSPYTFDPSTLSNIPDNFYKLDNITSFGENPSSCIIGNYGSEQILLYNNATNRSNTSDVTDILNVGGIKYMAFPQKIKNKAVTLTYYNGAGQWNPLEEYKVNGTTQTIKVNNRDFVVYITKADNVIVGGGYYSWRNK